jgi:hypothetical protein
MVTHPMPEGKLTPLEGGGTHLSLRDAEPDGPNGRWKAGQGTKRCHNRRRRTRRKRISWAAVHNSGLHVAGRVSILPAK